MIGSPLIGIKSETVKGYVIICDRKSIIEGIRK